MSHTDSAQLHSDATVVDLHAHPSMKLALFRHSLARRYGVAPPGFWPFSMRTNFDKLAQGGVDVLMSVIYAPEKPIIEDIPALKLLRYTSRHIWHEVVEPAYFAVAQTILQELEEQVATYNRSAQGRLRSVRIVRSVAELDETLAQGPTGPIVLVNAIEGAHALEGMLCQYQAAGRAAFGDQQVQDEVMDSLDTFFRQGVAYITLAHFYPNRLVHPCFPFPETVLPITRWRHVVANFDLSQGLTPLGESVVERMLELGMLIDVTHATPLARARIYQLAESAGKTAGVVATHVGARAFKPSPYCLDDWEMRWIADHGGVIGVIFMNYWLGEHDRLGLDLIARTLDHMVNVAGIDAVGIGSDFDGFTDPPDDLLDATQMPRLTQYLLGQTQADARPRYTPDQVRKILGGNALRVLRDGWARRGSAHQPQPASRNGAGERPELSRQGQAS